MDVDLDAPGQGGVLVEVHATRGQGLMPGGASRPSAGGERLHRWMGRSIFADHTVLPEAALVGIRRGAPVDVVRHIGGGAPAPR